MSSIDNSGAAAVSLRALMPLLLSGSLLILLELLPGLEILMLGALSPLLYYLLRAGETKTGRKRDKLIPVLVLLLVWQSVSLAWLTNIGLLTWGTIVLVYGISIFIPFLLFYRTLPRKGLAFAALLAGCFLVEYLHTQFFIGIPLQVLGYYLTTAPELIQWYDWGGAQTGSLWVLTVNAGLAFLFYRLRKKKKIGWRVGLGFASVLFLPIAISVFKFQAYEEVVQAEENMILAGVLQTSIDPRAGKYDASTDATLQYYDEILAVAEIPPGLDVLVMPENAFPALGWVDEWRRGRSEAIYGLRRRLDGLEIQQVLTGGIALEVKNDLPESAAGVIAVEDTGDRALMYNSVVLAGMDDLSFRTKEDLVPFEEYEPFPRLTPLLETIFTSLGGFPFSTRSENPSVLTANDLRIGAAICYESVYADRIGGMVSDGANMLAVILNEGWYDSNVGARLFENFSVARAIETRREVVRSSNGGLSSKISLRGERASPFSKEEQGLMVTPVVLSTELTFFTQFGVWLYRILAGSSVLFLAGIWLWPSGRGGDAAG